MTDLLDSMLALLPKPLFTVGPTGMTLSSLAAAVVLVLAIWWVAGALERTLLRMSHANHAEPWRAARLHMLSRVMRYAVWVVGTIVVLNYVGIDLSNVALVGGAIAFGLGFGLQNVFSNFIGGIIIMLERGLRIGDFVDLQSGVRGHVREIAMRYTRVTTNDSINVLVEISFPQRDLHVRGRRLDIRLERGPRTT
ncbi:MAG: mechanosensitive ion channel domain-containing protein [Betaproteobacteria bacterium]